MSNKIDNILKKDATTNNLTNYYEHPKMKEFISEYHNPNLSIHQISIPFRMGVIAGSGSGKTVFLLNLVAKMQDTFGHIFVVYRTSEPLYEFLAKSIGEKNITFITQLSKFPAINDLPKDKQLLCVFDDVINYTEKEQYIIKEIAIRGRKYGKGISMCYLSQSYYTIPKTIRLQFSYLIILKVGSKRDLNMILRDNSLGVEGEDLMNIYKDATKVPFDFLKISLNERNDDKRFSHNWIEFYEIDDIDNL